MENQKTLGTNSSLPKVIGAWTETYLDMVFNLCEYSYGTVGYNAYINLEESRFPLSVKNHTPYQALFWFSLARWNVIYKAKRK